VYPVPLDPGNLPALDLRVVKWQVATPSHVRPSRVPEKVDTPKPRLLRRAHACPDEIKFGCAQPDAVNAGPEPDVGPEPNAVNAGLEPDAVNAGPELDDGPEPNAVNAGPEPDAVNAGSEPDAGPELDAVNAGPEPDAGSEPHTVNAGPEPDAGSEPDVVNVGPEPDVVDRPSGHSSSCRRGRVKAASGLPTKVGTTRLSCGVGGRDGLGFWSQHISLWRSEDLRWSTREGWHDSLVVRGGWPGWTASGHSTSRHGECSTGKTTNWGWGLPIQGRQFLEIERGSLGAGSVAEPTRSVPLLGTSD
ncbi:hypothetical protein CRG98_027368, partial [Punica granatum]